MQHSPDFVRPRDVEDFNPKDRATIMSIDETLSDYDRSVEDHILAMQGVEWYEAWLADEQNGTGSL